MYLKMNFNFLPNFQLNDNKTQNFEEFLKVDPTKQQNFSAKLNYTSYDTLPEAKTKNLSFCIIFAPSKTDQLIFYCTLFFQSRLCLKNFETSGKNWQVIWKLLFSFRQKTTLLWQLWKIDFPELNRELNQRSIEISR